MVSSPFQIMLHIAAVLRDKDAEQVHDLPVLNPDGGVIRCNAVGKLCARCEEVAQIPDIGLRVSARVIHKEKFLVDGQRHGAQSQLGIPDKKSVYPFRASKAISCGKLHSFRNGN